MKNNKEQAQIKSIYIHIPFCKKICTYCDFCKMNYNKDIANKYLDELKNEIEKNYKGEQIETLYIGGGTPSCLDSNLLDKLFEIIKQIDKSKIIEYTFECNIEDINEEILKKLKNNKVNRISIGIESFNKNIQKILGRNYNFDIKDKINIAKKYFDNINIDLIYGVNTQKTDDLKQELNDFLSLDINHISIYSLILEENTILKINNYKEISDDISRQMYDYIVNTLEKNGYIQYEISNFSKDNTYSRHNKTYWDNEKYYGFGLGASGYIKNKRYTNTRSITKYLKGFYKKEEEQITKKIDMENFMILGLRKVEGVSNKEFKKRYGKNIEEIFKTDKLKQKNDNYYIAKDKLYISNYILEDFINI